MKHSLLTLAIIASAFTLSKATIYPVITSGFTFSPSSLTVTDQDTIIFNVGGGHNATEVSLSTWNMNGTAQLPGGFAFNGSNNVLTNLTAGSRYYVCTPHVGGVMKGQITITSTVGIKGTQANLVKRFYPNPIKDNLTINLQADEKLIRIVDILGNTIAEYNNLSEQSFTIDALANKPAGVYFALIIGRETSSIKLIKE
jgi:plastocyanin